MAAASGTMGLDLKGVAIKLRSLVIVVPAGFD